LKLTPLPPIFVELDLETSEPVLAVPRTRAEEVKELVERLKAQNYGAAVEHRRMYRPWG
jgi:mannose-1-phosphate guanylyltransferase/mannose-1-phosphate guanylyltransferase/mannose-6-phosphate isomerase